MKAKNIQIYPKGGMNMKKRLSNEQEIFLTDFMLFLTQENNDDQVSDENKKRLGEKYFAWCHVLNKATLPATHDLFALLEMRFEMFAMRKATIEEKAPLG